jgi:hypothetical protein
MTKIKKIKFLLPVVVIVIVIATINVAQAALVPCGPGVGGPCKWCHLFVLAKNIIDFIVYYLVFPITATMIVVGGLFIMTAGGSESRFSKGKEIATAAIVGLLIALTSWIIINTIMGVATGYTSIVGRPWNELQCK